VPLTAQAEEEALRLKLTPTPAAYRVAHMLGVRVPGGIPDGLSARLAAHNVYVGIRGDAIRIAPHLHSEPSDVERLFATLRQELS